MSRIEIQFPDPDVKTHKRLLSEARNNGPTAVGKLSAAMVSANVCFMVGTLGAEKTAEILRDWAAWVMRKQMTRQATEETMTAQAEQENAPLS
jgi:hypothetical protein